MDASDSHGIQISLHPPPDTPPTKEASQQRGHLSESGRTEKSTTTTKLTVSRTYLNPVDNKICDDENSATGQKRRAVGNKQSSADAVEGLDGHLDDSSVQNESDPEIQSIMGQFQEISVDPKEGIDPQYTTRNDLKSSGSIQHPPRLSSLDQIPSYKVLRNAEPAEDASVIQSQVTNLSRTPPEGAKTSSKRKDSLHGKAYPRTVESDGLASALPSSSLNKSLPPEPDPELDLPFDFHRFLEQLRHRTADPVAKFLRSFLVEFGKKQWMAHEQVKIISDFLNFITGKMQQCEIWREVSDAEFGNAREGMEKLVMNRLYTQTFSPTIPAPSPQAPGKGKKRASERNSAPGRRGQHQEDIERDGILAQKVRIYGWVRERHLDITPVNDGGKRFLSLAQQELQKINSYRAPRDKVICVLNCCKVIFGLLRNSQSADTSADSFIPLLIYVVLQASPEHLVSNIQYILRFRNQDKLSGEAGYYLSSLMGAIQFIENLDRSTLTVSDIEFEQKVEAAVSAMAERVALNESLASPTATQIESGRTERSDHTPNPGLDNYPHDSENKAAVGNLLRTIQKPLSSIGRIFSDETSMSDPGPGQAIPRRPQSDEEERTLRLSPAAFQPPGHDDLATIDPRSDRSTSPGSPPAQLAATQAVEAHSIPSTQYRDIVETLTTMFPNLERDIIEDVVRLKEGRIGSAVDACLVINA